MTPWRWLALVALLASAQPAEIVVAPHNVPSAATGVTVVSVGDGDTIRVRDAGRLVTLRLACNREGSAFAQA